MRARRSLSPIISARRFIKNPEDGDRFRSLLEHIGAIKDFEVICLKKNGQEITVLITGRALKR